MSILKHKYLGLARRAVKLTPEPEWKQIDNIYTLFFSRFGSLWQHLLNPRSKKKLDSLRFAINQEINEI